MVEISFNQRVTRTIMRKSRTAISPLKEEVKKRLRQYLFVTYASREPYDGIKKLLCILAPKVQSSNYNIYFSSHFIYDNLIRFLNVG